MTINVDSARKLVEQPMETMENITPKAYFGGMLGSIALSLFLFLIGKRQWSLFVGLWAPTILNMGQFAKTQKPSRR